MLHIQSVVAGEVDRPETGEYGNRERRSRKVFPSFSQF